VGYLAKVNISINKKRKIEPKTIDYVFVGYSLHSITYRFLVVNLEVYEISNDTIMESRHVTFFENVFPLKKINYLNLFIILLGLIYHLVVMLIRTLFFNLGGVKYLKNLRILVLNLYLKMILKLMVRSWGLLMHLFEKKLLMMKCVFLKLIKLGFFTNLSPGCKSML